jgi:hypothetical protein
LTSVQILWSPIIAAKHWPKPYSAAGRIFAAAFPEDLLFAPCPSVFDQSLTSMIRPLDTSLQEFLFALLRSIQPVFDQHDLAAGQISGAGVPLRPILSSI